MVSHVNLSPFNAAIDRAIRDLGHGGLTWLSAASGVNIRQWIRYQSGVNSTPNKKAAEKIARLFGVKPSDVVSGNFSINEHVLNAVKKYKTANLDRKFTAEKSRAEISCDATEEAILDHIRRFLRSHLRDDVVDFVITKSRDLASSDV